MQFYSSLHHLLEEGFWATVAFGMAQVQSTRKRRILRGLLDILLFLRYLTTQGVYSHARHTSKAHAKHETETNIVLVAADFRGITRLPLFSFVNPFLTESFLQRDYMKHLERVQ